MYLVSPVCVCVCVVLGVLWADGEQPTPVIYVTLY